MKKLLAVAAFAIILSGCSALTAIQSGNSAASSAPQTIAQAEKSLTVAHLAYQGLGNGLKSAAASGLLRGANAASAKVAYDNAGAALDVADAADAVANAQGITDAVAKAETLINQANSAIKGAP
jgi:hypothetical protein